MKTLDRYVIRTFLWSALMLLVALLALRIVSDLFLNMDEFMEDKSPLMETVVRIAGYYVYQSLMYFSELGGTVIVAAAAFTMARMNHTNELTAMLASGVSLHRVIMPMVVSAILLGGLITLDRELLIPANAEHLLRSRDEASEVRKFPVYLAPDSASNIWWSPMYDPSTRTMDSPMIAIREARKPLGTVTAVGGTATQGKFRPRGGQSLGGWEICIASLTLTAQAQGRQPWHDTPTTQKIFTDIGPDQLLESAKRLARQANIEVPPDSRIPSVSGIPPAIDNAYGMTITTRCPADGNELVFDKYEPGKSRGGRLTDPVFTYSVRIGRDGGEKSATRVIGIFHARYATWVPAAPAKGQASHWQLDDGRLFIPSDLTNEDLTLRQSSRWLDLMSLNTISRLLKRDKVPDRDAAILAKHVRFADPVNNLILLLLALPFILSRERNIKASAGLSVLMTGAYFAFIHITRVVGLPPMLAAFLPIVLFGTVAAVMLDSIKT
jgi:lipopolysaccharide export LptBFGC system permease protein LptF